MKLFWGLIGVFFLAGSIVNDAFVFGSESLSWAKVLFLFGLFCSLIYGIKLYPVSKQELLLFTYAFILILIAFLSSGKGMTDRTVSICVSLMIGVISFSVFTRLSFDVSYLIKSYLFWVVISVLISVVQSFFGSFYFTERVFESGLIPQLFRASGFMSDPNYFSLICLIALVLTRVVNCLFLTKVLFVVGVVLSGSRAGVLCLFIQFFFNHLVDRLTFKSFLLFIVSIFVISIVMHLVSGYLPDSMQMIFNAESYTQDSERNSLQDRYVAILAALDAFYHFPIIGYGLGNFVYYPSNVHSQMSHNSYIEMLAEIGFVGFSLYAVLVFYFFKQSKAFNLGELKVMSGDSRVYTTSLLCLIVFSIMSLTLVTYYSRIMFFVLSISFLLVRDRCRVSFNI